MPLTQQQLDEAKRLAGLVSQSSFSPTNDPNTFRQYQDLRGLIASDIQSNPLLSGAGNDVGGRLADVYLGIDKGGTFIPAVQGFGGPEDIQKQFGGLSGLADYIVKGGQVQQTAIPQTTNASGGQQGGYNALAPTATPGVQAPTPGQTDAPGGFSINQPGGGIIPQAPINPQQPQGATTPAQGGQTNATIDSGASGGVPDATLGVNGQAPLQVGGRFGTQQYGRLGNDVYEIMSDGSRRHVTEAEFNQKLRAQGLNLDAIPQLDVNDNLSDKPAGIPNPELNEEYQPKGPSDFLSDYRGIVKELGITDIKGEVERVKQEYIDLQNKKNQEIADVNDNPWLTEGLRVKEVEKIGRKYELRENTLSNQQKIYQSLYEEGLSQAQFITSGLQEDRNKMLDLAAKREEALADLLKGDYDIREVGGSLYRVDKNTGKSELLIKGATSGTGGDLSSKEQQLFLNITNKFQADSVMQQAANGVVVKGIANQVIANPDSATNQLKSLYSLVKNLDPDSAVREGELALANATQSYLQRFETSIARIVKGQTINPDAATALAQATIEIADLWDKAAQRRRTQYQSQANTISTNVGSAFSDYLTGFSNESTDASGDPEQDIKDTILYYKNQPQYQGSGARERLINDLAPLFQGELSLDDLGYYIYTLIPD